MANGLAIGWRISARWLLAALALAAGLSAAPPPAAAEDRPTRPTRPDRPDRPAARPAPAPVKAAPKSLQRQLDAILERSKLGPVQLGVCVVECSGGDVVAGINAKTPLIPASNMKLLSSGTALLVLGKDFEFRTRLAIAGDRLVILGAGDPGFADPELLKQMKVSIGGFLDRLVESARKGGASGLREVVVDDRIFDRDGAHPSWPADQLNRWYCAEVSGMNFHANILQIFPAAGERPGPAPMPRVEPSANWIELVNTLQTVATGSTAVGAIREGDLRFKIMGSIRATLIEPVDVTLRNPASVFARLVADHVAAAGLAAADGKVAWRLSEPGDQFDDAQVVAVVRTPLATALKRCNTDSHNLYAESFIKRVGHDVTGQPGSWGNGATVIRMQLTEKIGQESGELVIADGSGMSRENRVTAQTLASWLGAVARTPDVADVFLNSLAAPGEGTLEKRFKGRKLAGKVYAKSGFLNGVQCLSGYVHNPATGRKAAFSVLVNNITSQTPGGRVKEFHEEVVELVDQWLASGGEALGG